jgi:hypothetical protein
MGMVEVSPNKDRGKTPSLTRFKAGASVAQGLPRHSIFQPSRGDAKSLLF